MPSIKSLKILDALSSSRTGIRMNGGGEVGETGGGGCKWQNFGVC